ncbi:MAG: heavy-metal-associated domain-containing protein [Melioribacteraceae bacterium]|nr:heavy-metal-associated domain-containing protein [Melioribacteraceae bacterium]
MKTINKSIVLFLSVIMLSFINISAQDEAVRVTTEFKVFGNCGMCEKRIEKALNVEGVDSADWNKETKMATVVFNQAKISEEQLHKNVAEVGHDTKMYKAEDEVYAELPNCCKFEREETDNKHHMHKDEDEHKHEMH